MAYLREILIGEKRFACSWMNMDEPCTDMYIHCIAKSMQCIYNVQTRYMNWNSYISVHTCSDQVYTGTNMYSHACSSTYLFSPCTYQVHTLNVQVHVSMYIVTKSKKSRFELKTSCISSGRLNHYASSVLEIDTIVTVYVVPGGWWRTSGAGPAAPPARDVAGPSLNMDLFKAEVAVHSGTQPHPSPPLTGPATGTGTSLALLKVWLPWLQQKWYRSSRHAGAGRD